MKIKKYQNPSSSIWKNQTPTGEDWREEWKYRLTPVSRSKVAGGWSSKGKIKKASESGEQYTKRRVKEETKRTWRSDVADVLHGIGEGVLALHPYTAIPYYGAKVGQDILNGSVDWGTALNLSVPLFHVSPQTVGLREATNVALEDAANAGSKTARNWRVAREVNDVVNRGLLRLVTQVPSKIKQIVNNTKQSRLVSPGTYPWYRGPRFDVNEIVNSDGTVNPRKAMQVQHTVAKQFGKGAHKMEHRLENPAWHKEDPNTYEHTKRVAQSAWKLPTPEGYTKQDQMIAALGHDFGKIISGDGHAQIGADLAEQVFIDIKPHQLQAIKEHMGQPTTQLGEVTKAADMLNGRNFNYLRQASPELYNKILRTIIKK